MWTGSAVGPAPRHSHHRGAGPHITDVHRREAVEAAAESAWRTVAGLAEDLPVQVIHGDITGDNVVCGAPDSHDLRGHPDGVIDFGDLMRSWTVGELAVTVSGCCTTKVANRRRRCRRSRPSMRYGR